MKNLTLHPNFDPLDLDNPDHNKAMVLLCLEWEFNSELVDLRENIEAPLEQLSKAGQLEVTVFRSLGIKTRNDVDLIEDLFDKAPDNGPEFLSIDHLKYIP